MVEKLGFAELQYIINIPTKFPYNSNKWTANRQADNCALENFCFIFFLILSQTTNFRLFQKRKFAQDIFKFDKNGRKFSKQVENNVGKGEIVLYEQFLLFPVLSKDLYCRCVKTRACLGKDQEVTNSRIIP